LAATAQQRDASGIRWLPMIVFCPYWQPLTQFPLFHDGIRWNPPKNICGHGNFRRIPPDSNRFCWPLSHRNSILLFYLNAGDETLHALKTAISLCWLKLFLAVVENCAQI
jgi:hypothetical protein